MKKLILSVLCAMVALAGCQGIDENGVNPSQSGLKVTAVIADNSTRVDYEVVDNTVSPEWAVGDEVFGYDGTGTFTFTVTDVDDNGMATFAAGDYTPEDGTTLYAVYYPAGSAANFTSGELAVDLTSQDGVLDGTAPAIMCATATVENGEVNFHFYNQTAIIGVKKFQVNPDEEIEYLSIKGLVAKGTIKVDNGTLSLVPAAGTMDMTVKFDSAIKADSEGIYSTPIYFMALPTEGAQIGVAASSATFTHCNTTAVKKTDIEAGQYYYLSKKLDTDDSHVARYSNDGGANWTYTTSLADAVKGIATTTAKADGKVELLKDYTLKSQIKISGQKFTWNGNGHTVSFVSKYSEITDNYQGAIHVMSSSDVDFTDTKFVGQGTSVTATDRPFAVVAATASFGKDVTISDFKNSRPYAGAIWGNKQSVIYLKDNLKITNCHNAPASSSYGGGAICSDAAVYVQDDVIISNCSSAFWGGAILSNDSNGKGMLTMSGNACIESCESGNGGGAIALKYGSKLTLTDDVLIKDCISSTAGGGICNMDTKYGFSIEMKGNAHITGCKALSGDGGGIRDNATASTMTVSENALIDNCSCTGKGGGLYEAGTYTVKGNVRIENCSAKNGGGIAVWRKATLDENVLIKSCTASENGGGVYVAYNSTDTAYGQLTIKGLIEIEDCTATYGGAVYAETGKFNIEGGTISGCSVSGSGGAVYNKGGEVNMSAGTISNCKASSNNGGAIYNPSTFNMSGGTISGCSAVYGGGIDNRGTVSLIGGTITGCSSSKWGGGIYNTSSATTTIDGGAISACTGTYGAAISVNSGSVTLTSGSVSTDSGYAIGKSTNTNDVTININGGSVLSSEAGGIAVYVGSKGGTLNINGGTIESKGSSKYTVYNVQSTVNINAGSKLTTAYRLGYVEAGSININGGLLTGKDGINVNSSTSAETKLIIKGGEMNFTGSSSNCAWFYTNSETDKIITLDIQGGKFKCGGYVLSNTGTSAGEAAGMPANSVKKISGGLFYAYTGAMSTMASNAGCKFSAEKNADGYFEVIPK